MNYSLCRVLCIAFALLNLFGASRCFSQEAIATPVMPPSNFSGVWETTFGQLTFRQNGAAVTGEYEMGGRPATITGTVFEHRLTFTYKEHNATGEGWFEIAPGAGTFEGQWRQDGSEQWAPWKGKLVVPPSFEGLWQTSFGPMRLRLTDNVCQGVYDWNGIHTIRGGLEGPRFIFTYEQTDGEKGEGWFELAADAMFFKGEWKSATMEKPGSWNGTRVQPQRGVTWLVVLEAHWEGSLKDREYSYGEMQRAFFKRLPHVAFRHRFVHDLADVQSFCGELAFIAEPVVLYFSSHGTQNGISVGSGVVTPEQIAAALRGASNIKLLHFGACEVMAGDAPKRLIAALPPNVRFPISGFANTADWAGSAIVDFTYLDLVLEYRMEPAAAVDEVRKSVRFADDAGKRGTIPSSLLRIYEEAPAP